MGDGSSASLRTRATDLSDDFFELSVDEVKRLYKDRVQEAKKAASSDGELTTRAYKAAQEEASKLKYAKKQ